MNLTSGLINTKQTALPNDGIFRILSVCFFCAFVLFGISNHLFGMEFFTDFSTFFIYLCFLVQLFTNKIRIAGLLISVSIFIILQTFVLNIGYIDFASSLKHFIGLFLFIVVIFSFVSVYRYKLKEILHLFFNFCFWLSCFAIFQTVVFVVLGISIIPQNIIAGVPVYGTTNFVPEVFDRIPRAVGLSTEPAHYCLLLMPALYVSILKLAGGSKELGNYSRKRSLVILIAFILSFSIVGYLGLLICLVFIFKKQIKTNTIMTFSIAVLFVSCVVVLMQTSIGGKIVSFISTSQDITGSEYTSSDQTSFALLSNLVVAGRALQISHFLGTGMNSHVITYNNTIFSLFSETQIFNQLNKENAGSLFIRIPSEFGIPGLIAYIFFLFRFYAGSKYRDSWAKTLNHIGLVCLLAYSTRNGQYLDIHFVFFAALFFYSYKLVKEDKLLTATTKN